MDGGVLAGFCRANGQASSARYPRSHFSPPSLLAGYVPHCFLSLTLNCSTLDSLMHITS